MIYLRIKTFLSGILSQAPTQFLRQLLDITAKSLHRKTGHIYTFCERPGNIQNFIAYHQDTSSSSIGIVMQGPYVTDTDFTKNTLLLYRVLYPDKLIVLSTWAQSIPEADLESLRKVGIIILESTPPQKTGTLNINFQIRTTNKGLNWIKNSAPHITHVLKTRTDQRIYQSNLFSYLLDLQRLLGAKDKLVALSFHSKKEVLGSVSDLFIFGTRVTVEKYFSVPEQDFNIDRKTFFEKNPHPLNPEQIFFTNFTGTLPLTFNDYCSLLKSHFLLVDKEQIDFYWHKYSNLENRKIYNSPKDETFWSFQEYLDL